MVEVSPQPAGMDAPSAPESGPRARDAHRVLVPLLLVLATLIGIGAAFAVWVNRQALNTNNWSSTSAKILEDKQVQTALSAYLVHELFTNVNVSADLQTILPKPLQPLAGPAAAGLQQLAGQLAPKVLASPQVQAAWVQANIAAHKELLKVLNGGGPVVSTKSGVVTLNLQALVKQLAATLGITSQVAGGQAEARDHGAALGGPVGDHALRSAQDRAGHRQGGEESRDRVAGGRVAAVRAGGVSRTRPAPADVADDGLVLCADRDRAAVDPPGGGRCGRQRAS